MERKDKKNFVVYEYRDIAVKADQAALYMDAYESFGWEPDDRMQAAVASGKVGLRFRRDKKILNKAELTRLQRNFDSCMEEIRLLEESKKVRQRPGLSQWA